MDFGSPLAEVAVEKTKIGVDKRFTTLYTMSRVDFADLRGFMKLSYVCCEMILMNPRGLGVWSVQIRYPIEALFGWFDLFRIRGLL